MDKCRYAARNLAASLDCTFVDPSDEEVVTGQATVCVEFSEQAAGLDAIILPYGGGSLLGGSAVFYDRSGTLVFAVEPELGGPRLAESLRRMTRPEHDASSTGIADGLSTSLSDSNWRIVCSPGLLAGAIVESEEEILDVLQLHRAVSSYSVEPTGIIALSAALCHDTPKFPPATGRTWRLGVVISGSNAG